MSSAAFPTWDEYRRCHHSLLSPTTRCAWKPTLTHVDRLMRPCRSTCRVCLGRSGCVGVACVAVGRPGGAAPPQPGGYPARGPLPRTRCDHCSLAWTRTQHCPLLRSTVDIPKCPNRLGSAECFRCQADGCRSGCALQAAARPFPAAAPPRSQCPHLPTTAATSRTRRPRRSPTETRSRARRPRTRWRRRLRRRVTVRRKPACVSSAVSGNLQASLDEMTAEICADFCC